jgi:hypothetical protein
MKTEIITAISITTNIIPEQFSFGDVSLIFLGNMFLRGYTG